MLPEEDPRSGEDEHGSCERIPGHRVVRLAGGHRTHVLLQRCPIAVRWRNFRNGIHSPDLRYKEPVSALRDGLDVSGIFGVVVQRVPEFANRHPEAAVEVDEGVAGPEAAAKLLAADDFSGSFEEHEEEAIGLLLQPYGSPILHELA
jgi:hypothetical protein